MRFSGKASRVWHVFVRKEGRKKEGRKEREKSGRKEEERSELSWKRKEGRKVVKELVNCYL